MNMSDFKHEFGVRPHILAQVVICYIQKVTKFAPWDVVGILWNEFQLNAFFEEFQCVTIGLPFLLPHCPTPSYTSLQDRMLANIFFCFVLVIYQHTECIPKVFWLKIYTNLVLFITHYQCKASLEVQNNRFL
jgi:hypothetical protein